MIGLVVLPRVVAVLSVVVLTACTTQVSGSPVAGTTVPAEPEELTAEAVFEDFTTVDPCSLTESAAFDSFGKAGFGTPESLDYCVIDIDPPDGSEVVIAVGAFGELAALPDLEGKKVKDVEGGLWIGQQDDTPSFCSQLLVFPDGVTMQVQGNVYDGGEIDTCPMVEAGMERAIQAVQDGEVRHRDPERDSLVRVDPCSLIDDDEVVTVPGLAGMTRPNEYPARHTCFWEVEGATRTTLRVEFSAGAKPSSYGEAGANEDPVAGRPSATNPYPEVGEASYCAVETAHLPFTEIESAEDMFELASVFVRMPAGKVVEGCAAARAVAEVVWPKLPKP